MTRETTRIPIRTGKERGVIDPLVVEELIERALAEDIGFCDLTSELVIPADAKADFLINTRQDIVVAGIAMAAQVFRRRVPEAGFETFVRDGERASRGTRLARVTGPARGLLSAERTALNFLQHMSGIATETAKYVEKIKGTKAVLIDTRKTHPGLRALEKHAAWLGGARNHRLRLDDGILIKDNHISVCGSITAAVAKAKAGVPVLTRVEVECDRLEQVREAVEAGADMILLDNMDADTMREAVKIAGGRVPLEASGGITLDTARAKAESGVDYISTGRITQSSPAVDIGLDVTITT
jgi:nicotinate-nucleotide pyrophosphorylase (carboxylating)